MPLCPRSTAASAVPLRVSEALRGVQPNTEQEVEQENVCWDWGSVATSAADLTSKITAINCLFLLSKVK